MLFMPLKIRAMDEQAKLNQLKPEAKEVFTQFLQEARETFPKQKIIVAEVYRTQARQDKLFEKGSSTTMVRVSMHTKRLAADIYFVKNGKILPYEKAPYLILGRIAERLGLTWGGRWKVPFDPGHYELRGVK